MKPRVLSVSNGYAEDLVAAEILRHLPDVHVVAYPLVGLGPAYPAAIERLDPRKDFPSGGLALRTKGRVLVDDLRAGFARFLMEQYRTLTRQRGRFQLTLAVGDYFCLAMALRAAAPAVLVATAMTVYHGRYRPVPIWILRRALRVFTRDAPTAEYLRANGIRAQFLGNPMLDPLRPAGTDFGLGPDEPVVALLPGSRGEAVPNAVLLAQAAARVSQAMPETRFLLPVAPSVEDRAIAQALRQAGGTDGHGGIAVGGARLQLTRAFADAIARAAVVVGLAGTAVEQAAGLGKPIVAFPGSGPAITGKFLSTQRKLLGEAVVAVPSPEQAADAVLRLLRSPEERAWRGRVGRERMGEPGATARIGAELRALLTACGGATRYGRPTPA